MPIGVSAETLLLFKARAIAIANVKETELRDFMIFLSATPLLRMARTTQGLPTGGTIFSIV
jgi:hypothetical protein